MYISASRALLTTLKKFFGSRAQPLTVKSTEPKELFKIETIQPCSLFVRRRLLRLVNSNGRYCSLENISSIFKFRKTKILTGLINHQFLNASSCLPVKRKRRQVSREIRRKSFWKFPRCSLSEFVEKRFLTFNHHFEPLNKQNPVEEEQNV